MKVLGEEYYTFKEAAELLSVDRRTIHAWRKQGKLNPVKVGNRRILFSLEELKKAVQPQLAQSQTA